MAAARTTGPSTSLRSGRDDNSVETAIDATEQKWTPQQNCHPDRSVAKWRELRFFPSSTHTPSSAPP
jgi:hypothetical protein